MAEETGLNGEAEKRRTYFRISVAPLLRLKPFSPCPPWPLLLAAAIAAGCGRSPITPNRIETAIETTFANRLELQVARLKLKPLPAPEFAITAICQKPAGAANIGGGDWVCTLVWQGPDRQALRDTYDLSVSTDGCYTATVAGESLGGPTLRTDEGATVKNLLYTFEGCFDVT
jgi:hypothetical protein